MNDDKQAVHNLRRPLKKAAAVLAAAVLLLSSGCNKAQPETELFSLLLEKQEQEQRQSRPYSGSFLPLPRKSHS